MKKPVDDLSDLNEGHAHDFLDYITNHAEQDRAYNVTQPDGTVSKMKRVGYAPGATRVFMLQFHAIARVLVTGIVVRKTRDLPVNHRQSSKGFFPLTMASESTHRAEIARHMLHHYIRMLAIGC